MTNHHAEDADERLMQLATLIDQPTSRAVVVMDDIQRAANCAALMTTENVYDLLDGALAVFRGVYGHRRDVSVALAQAEAWLDLPPVQRSLGAAWHVKAWLETVPMTAAEVLLEHAQKVGAESDRRAEVWERMRAAALAMWSLDGTTKYADRLLAMLLAAMQYKWDVEHPGRTFFEITPAGVVIGVEEIRDGCKRGVVQGVVSIEQMINAGDGNPLIDTIRYLRSVAVTRGSNPQF